MPANENAGKQVKICHGKIVSRRGEAVVIVFLIYGEDEVPLQIDDESYSSDGSRKD